MYHEVTVYVGTLDGGVLKDITPANFRTDYTPEEVEANRERYKAAKKAADEAQFYLYPFGEYDR